MDKFQIDQICDATHYGRNAASDAVFSMGQANMFANVHSEHKGDTGLHSSIAERVAETRRHLESALRQVDAAERALSPLGESRREYLHRTTVNMNVVESLSQKPRVIGFDTDAQSQAMIAVANRFGLRDAVIWLRDLRAATKGTDVQTLLDLLPEGFGSIPQQEQCQSAMEDQIDALEIIADRYGLTLAAVAFRERPRPSPRTA